jgi:hypothetical protein
VQLLLTFFFLEKKESKQTRPNVPFGTGGEKFKRNRKEPVIKVVNFVCDFAFGAP